MNGTIQKPKAVCYISLGSNIGDRLFCLQFAARELNAMPQTIVTAKSSVFHTQPWGGVEQDNYFNAALELETALPPLKLLAHCQEIEARAGRMRGQRWGPRSLDIDIMLYDGLHLHEPELTIPHPRMHLRLFMLLPLLEIAGDIPIPGRGALATLIRDCSDELGAEPVCAAEDW